MAKEFLIENVRLSWVYVDKRDENDKFRATSLLDKSNPDHKRIRNEILDEVDFLVEDGIKNNTDWKGREPKNILTLKNGDDSEYEYEVGHWLLGASNKNEIPMVLQNREKEATGKDIYAGVYANVVVQVYAMGGKYPGVYCSLEAIQKVKDGERLGGGGPVNPKTKFQNLPGADDDDLRDRGRDRDDDRGRGRDRDEEPPRRGRDDDPPRRSSRDDDPPRRDRDEDPPRRDRDDDRGRGRDRDEDPPKRNSRDDDPPRRDSRDRDDDRGRGRDRDEEPPRRGRDDDYDRGRDRGRERF